MVCSVWAVRVRAPASSVGAILEDHCTYAHKNKLLLIDPADALAEAGIEGKVDLSAVCGDCNRVARVCLRLMVLLPRGAVWRVEEVRPMVLLWG